ncbi:hypothetical protein HYV50_04135 [Candidatus Pacearchaeota archaeon]|nr:hypothetical protein [Candidatus Pacearchaeota archaeon]
MTNQKGHITKLRQAKYHLENMKQKVKSFPFEEFAFELCAFIEVARGITWAMQKEYSNNQKFKEWYLKKQVEMGKDSLFKFFTERRNAIVKEGHPGSNAFTFYLEMRVSVPPNETVGVILPQGIFTAEEDIKAKTTDSKEIPMEKKVIRTPVFQELQSRHVIEVCEEYFVKIEALINEAKTFD